MTSLTLPQIYIRNKQTKIIFTLPLKPTLQREGDLSYEAKVIGQESTAVYQNSWSLKWVWPAAKKE